MGGSPKQAVTDTRDADAIEASIGAIVGSALGRAPVRVQVVSRDPRLTVLVSGTRTRLESTLLQAGDRELVRRGRDALRDALEDALRAAVERSLGARVDAMSGSYDPPSGTEVLLFDLAGRSSSEPTR